jgi:hypothetical protein
MDEPALSLLQSPPVAASSACTNCGEIVTGNYCSHCGQRLEFQLHSLGYFLGEATEAVTHADARVWRTLLPLLTRPGFLTREYFAGRRARYLHPFRLYLILSVTFFLLGSLLRIHPDVTAPRPGAESQQSCANIQTDLPGAAWLVPRLTATCRSIAADGGRAFAQTVVHNLGRGMFLFLPLLAALMKLLYWRPRRYYLEHLLLLIHNHAFVFLLLSLFMLATHWASSSAWTSLCTLALIFYLGRYLYRSMKNMYGQSAWLTLFKFNVLGFAYLIGGLIMLVMTAVFSAVTL